MWEPRQSIESADSSGARACETPDKASKPDLRLSQPPALSLSQPPASSNRAMEQSNRNFKSNPRSCKGFLWGPWGCARGCHGGCKLFRQPVSKYHNCFYKNINISFAIYTNGFTAASWKFKTSNISLEHVAPCGDLTGAHRKPLKLRGFDLKIRFDCSIARLLCAGGWLRLRAVGWLRLSWAHFKSGGLFACWFRKVARWFRCFVWGLTRSSS